VIWLPLVGGFEGPKRYHLATRGSSLHARLRIDSTQGGSLGYDVGGRGEARS